MNRQSGKVSSGVLAVVAVLFIGASLGVLGYWYGTKDKESTVDQSTEMTAKKDVADSTAGDEFTKETEATKYCQSTADIANFYDKVIGLEFCYPNAWGKATVGSVQASASLNGSAYEITFSSNPAMTVSSATPDYVNTIGRGGRCADPSTTAPDFSMYDVSWNVDGVPGDMQSASRYHIKKDGQYLVHEWVGDFGEEVCLTAKINMAGGAYEVVTVNYRVSYGSGVTTVPAHIGNPEVLIPELTRTQFMELVESVRKP